MREVVAGSAAAEQFFGTAKDGRPPGSPPYARGPVFTDPQQGGPQCGPLVCRGRFCQLIPTERRESLAEKLSTKSSNVGKRPSSGPQRPTQSLRTAGDDSVNVGKTCLLTEESVAVRQHDSTDGSLARVFATAPSRKGIHNSTGGRDAGLWWPNMCAEQRG